MRCPHSPDTSASTIQAHRRRPQSSGAACLSNRRRNTAGRGSATSPQRRTCRGIAEWLVDRLSEDQPARVGIDHGFSFPMRYFGIAAGVNVDPRGARLWRASLHEPKLVFGFIHLDRNHEAVFRFCGTAPRRRGHSLHGIAAIAGFGLPPPRTIVDRLLPRRPYRDRTVVSCFQIPS